MGSEGTPGEPGVDVTGVSGPLRMSMFRLQPPLSTCVRRRKTRRLQQHGASTPKECVPERDQLLFIPLIKVETAGKTFQDHGNVGG